MIQTPAFGQWLKHLRAALDLTQEAAAEQIGCAAETLRAFERGIRRPSRTMAERLAEVLHVPLDQRAEFVRMARVGTQAEPEPLLSELPATPPTPESPLTSKRASMPSPASTLIGRDAELATIITRLHDPDCRCLTLLGPGGVGKTRLALQAAHQVEQRDLFADGVVWVNFGSLDSPDHIVTALATSLDYTLHGAGTPNEQVIDYLRGRELLLVLDNLEHVLAIVPLLLDLLQAAPGVRLLATSRERLRLPGEWVIELGGLLMPSEGRTHAEAPAVRLFLERARQIDHRFKPDPEQIADIDRICRLLGGLPLGIELAATWVRTLSCAEIAAEIERGLDFLAVHGPVAEPRHASLRAVFAHSWAALSPVEQAVLMRMAIMRGGCRREAVEAVAAQIPGVRPMLPILASLLDKSLLQRSADSTGVTRYELHELVRQFAAEHLAADPQALADACTRHAVFFAGWAAAQEPRLKSAQQKTALQLIGIEIENLRVAWQWAIAQHRPDVLLQMACTLDWFFDVRGWTDEGAAMFDSAGRLLQAAATNPHAPRQERSCYWLARALAGWHRVRSIPDEARFMLYETLPQLCDLAEPSIVFHNLVGVSYLALFTGDLAAIQQLIDRGLAIRHPDDSWSLAVALNVSGVLAGYQGNYLEAVRLLEDGLATLRHVGDPREIAFSLNNLGMMALALDRMLEAGQYYREALVLTSEHRNRFQMSTALRGLGQIAALRGDYAEAQWMLHEALAVAREANERVLIARTQAMLAYLARLRGDHESVRQLYHNAVTIAADIPPVALDLLFDLAAFEWSQTFNVNVLPVLAVLHVHTQALPPTRAQAAALLHDLRLAVQQAADHTGTPTDSAHPLALLRLLRPR